MRFKLETLYNHVPFLKAANRKFAAPPSSSSKNKNEKKVFTKTIQLQSDTTISIKHNQRTKLLRVTAIRTDGSRYPIRYRVDDSNNITLLSKDTVNIKLTVAPRRRKEDQGWYKALQLTSRLAMSVRSFSISYTNNYNMAIPGFLPQVGDVFGQRNSGGLQPGLDFAFGMVGDSYIERAARRGWLLQSDSVITPATTAGTEDLQLRASLEPFRDIKIELNANRTENQSRSIQYMFESMPTTRTGSFSMTTISIGSAFTSPGNADNGYKNSTFTKFVSLLETYRNRVEKKYEGATYPEGTSLAGQPYSPENGAVNKYGSEVMIPAFLDAYTASGGGLDIFPSLARLLPNWSITYSGLSKLPKMKKVFKSFNLNHGYKSTYAVGAYSSYSAFCEYLGGWGFINDVATGLPVPSGMYDVSTVSLNESFNPLFGVDMTFLNNLTAKFEWRRTRVLALSMTSQQISETRSNDFVIGLGYKIANLNLFAPKRTVRSKGKKGEDSKNASQGFANDLNMRLDFSIRNQSALNRDIPTTITQATSGNNVIQVNFSADYALSRYLTLTAYYDRQFNKPLLTTNSYPIKTQDFGISIKFMLTR